MLKLENLVVEIAEFKLQKINLNIDKNEILVLLGPSGSGKTTILKTILGLIKPENGIIWYNDKDITNEIVSKRQISYVPQKPTLYPHMTVKENIEYGLKIKKIVKDEREKRIEEVIEFLGLSLKINELPHNLSGGESQKVSLARAFVQNLPLILMDEPLTGIDFSKAKEIRKLIKDSVTRYSFSVIYVTHHLNEATDLATRIAILNNGKIERIAYPEKLLKDPGTQFVANFFEFENIFHGKVKKTKIENSVLICGKKGTIKIIIAELEKEIKDDEKVTIAIRSENILLSKKPLTRVSARNCIMGRIIGIHNRLGKVAKIIVDCGINFVVALTQAAIDELEIRKDQEIYLIFKATAVSVIK